MEAELWAKVLSGHDWLAGVADMFGPLATRVACLEVLGFPPQLVTSKSEAGRVADYLTNSTKG